MFAASLSESLGSLLAATVAIAIGTSVLLRDREREQFVRFAWFCFNLGLYHLARFFFGFSGVHLFGWAAQTVSLALPWTADRCFSTFVPGPTGRLGARIRAALGALLLGAQLLGLVVPNLASNPWWDAEPLALWVYVVGGLLHAAARMWRAARTQEGTAAASRLRYLFYASVIALALGSPMVPGIGPIVTAVYLYFIAQTLTRERLLDLPEVAGRIASMAILVAIVTGLYALLLLWVPRRGSGRTLFLFNAAVASFAVVVLVDPVRRAVEGWVEGKFLRDRGFLRQTLVQLRRSLANVIAPEEMVEVILRELRTSDRVTRASIYLLDRQGAGLLRRGHIGPPGPARLDLARQRPLLERLARSAVLVRDELERELARTPSEARGELEQVLDTLDALGASLAVPIRGPDPEPEESFVGSPTVLGALFADDERLLEPFAREEIELLRAVAAQAATTLQNSAVYEARKERERLAALGEMAAGLAHEIRNPLGAIKGAAQVLQPTGAAVDPHTREFLSVIVDEVERLNRVVSQFLTYSRPFSGARAPTRIDQVLASTVRMLPPKARARVEVRPTPPDLPPILGDGDALQQVFHNLMRNAADATADMDPPGQVWVEVELDAEGGALGRPAIIVRVRDRGPGLSAQTLTNLFVPFHTTKSGGTGLGLPISQRIVENHGGTIEASNDPDGGACFSVALPLSSPPPQPEPASP